MLQEPLAVYCPLPVTGHSAYSQPPSRLADGTYEIHLIKGDDPAYIPSDLEVWPLYHRAIVQALEDFPAARLACVEAVKTCRQRIKGFQNPFIPPGSVPRVF